MAMGDIIHICASTKRIISYSKHGDLVAARRVFDEMPHRTVVSWTALISGYSRNGYFVEALRVFRSMCSSETEANQFTYGSTLRACTGLGCLRSGLQVHGCVSKNRFVGDLFVQSALMDMHLKCGSIDDAWRLFRRMDLRDVVAWNSMIGGCALRGFADDAFGLFCLMLRDGELPDRYTFGNVLRACAISKNLVKLNQIHTSIIKYGLGNHHVVSGSMVDAYAKCRSLSNAKLLYDSMTERDLIASTALITGYSMEKSSIEKAFDIFCVINCTSMAVDDVILSSMLNICANASSLSFGKQIHGYIFKKCPGHDAALGNALLDMYAKSGDLHAAHRAFDEMQDKNVISWTSLIAGYGQNGYGDVAGKLFAKMVDEKVKPNDVTFLCLLSACSHSGLITKGLEYLNFMKTKYGIHPRTEHYSCAIDLLARNGKLKDAYDLLCRINIKPSASLWGSMLGACEIYGETSVGVVVARHALNLFPETSANYVALANVYASAGLWQAAMKMREEMEQQFLKKNSGYSFIS